MPDAVSGETVRARKGKVIVFPPGNTCPGQYLLSVGDPLKMLSALDVVRVAKQSAFPKANGANMRDIEKVYAFENLFKAYKAARLGKRGTKEEIQFENGNIAESGQSVERFARRDVSDRRLLFVHDSRSEGSENSRIAFYGSGGAAQFVR